MLRFTRHTVPAWIQKTSSRIQKNGCLDTTTLRIECRRKPVKKQEIIRTTGFATAGLLRTFQWARLKFSRLNAMCESADLSHNSTSNYSVFLSPISDGWCRDSWKREFLLPFAAISPFEVSKRTSVAADGATKYRHKILRCFPRRLTRWMNNLQKQGILADRTNVPALWFFVCVLPNVMFLCFWAQRWTLGSKPNPKIAHHLSKKLRSIRLQKLLFLDGKRYRTLSDSFPHHLEHQATFVTERCCFFASFFLETHPMS